MSNMSASYITRKKYNITYMQDYDVKTSRFMMQVYYILHLCLSAPLYEASCSNDSDVYTDNLRHRSKAYFLVCIASKTASVPSLAAYCTES